MMNKPKATSLIAATLLLVSAQLANAHAESRPRIGLGLSFFFPHVGLHISSSGGGHHHHHDGVDSNYHHGNQQLNQATPPPSHRAGPRSKRRVTSTQQIDNTSHHADSAKGKSRGNSTGQASPNRHYCQQQNADPIHCLATMQSQ